MKRKIDPAKLKVIQLIHISLMASVLVFTGFVLYTSNGLNFDFDINEPFNWVAVFIAIIGFFMGNTLFNKALSGVDRTTDMDIFFNRFQTGHIIRMAFLEGPAIFSVIVCMLTGSQSLLLLTTLLFAIMYSYFPTEDRISRYF